MLMSSRKAPQSPNPHVLPPSHFSTCPQGHPTPPPPSRALGGPQPAPPSSCLLGRRLPVLPAAPTDAQELTFLSLSRQICSIHQTRCVHFLDTSIPFAAAVPAPECKSPSLSPHASVVSLLSSLPHCSPTSVPPAQPQPEGPLKDEITSRALPL